MLKRLFVTLTFLAIVVGTADAEVEEVRVQVKGLACPFCTFGIEKYLKKVPGVLSAETTIKTGVVRLRLKPESSLDLQSFRNAVARAGFTFEYVEATLRGNVMRREGSPVLEAETGAQQYRLTGPAEGTTGAQDTEVRARLAEFSGDRATHVRVTGRLSGTGSAAALAVQSIEVIP
jgi:cation transport ATPase